MRLLSRTTTNLAIAALAVIGLLGAGGVLVARHRGGEDTGESTGEGDSQE